MLKLAFFWSPHGCADASRIISSLKGWPDRGGPDANLCQLIFPARMPDLSGWREKISLQLPEWDVSVCELPLNGSEEALVATSYLVAAHALARRARIIALLPGVSKHLPKPDTTALLDSPPLAYPVIDGRDEDINIVLSRCEEALATSQPSRKWPVSTPDRPRLAYVSPLPPERSGIADYSARLLEGLRDFFDITLFCASPELLPTTLADTFEAHNYAELPSMASNFDRVAYHMGNSQFHNAMWSLIHEVPGIVVLHDVFLGGAIHAREAQGETGIVFERFLEDHGVAGLESHFSIGQDAAIQRFPLNRSLLARADGVIVHSEHAARLVRTWQPPAGLPLQVVPLGVNAKNISPSARLEARQKLGLGDSDCLVCTFGFLGPTKLNDLLLDAWRAAKLPQDPQAHLVFVGQRGGDYGEKILAMASLPTMNGRVTITGYTSGEIYEDYLNAADFAVQLRCHSRGESSATILDCLARGIPCLVNAHGSAAELPDDAVLMLPDTLTAENLAQALKQMREDAALRSGLRERGLEYAQSFLSIDTVARAHANALMNLDSPGITRIECGLSRQLAALLRDLVPDHERREDLIAEWSAMVTRNAPAIHPPRLLLELTGIGQNDLRTGIERSTRNLTRALLHVERPDLWPEPIRHDPIENEVLIWRTQRYMTKLCQWPNIFQDTQLRVEEGDFLLMIDTSWGYYQNFPPLFQALRDRGGKIAFFVHDLLPLELPDCFPADFPDHFRRWMLFVIKHANAVICGSKTSAEAVIRLATEEKQHLQRPLHIGFSHYGADINRELATNPSIRDKLSQIFAGKTPVFLMVGTLEPRKGHQTVLDAFEIAWQQGAEVSLCLIGKLGWMMTALEQRLLNHPEWEKRLYWADGASDDELDFAYRHAHAVICASRGEGFGLPIIEAAQYGVPVILSDLPIFREVAGKSAEYFPVGNAGKLAEIVQHWSIQKPEFPAIHWLTWQQSANNLASLILDGRWHYTVTPTS